MLKHPRLPLPLSIITLLLLPACTRHAPSNEAVVQEVCGSAFETSAPVAKAESTHLRVWGRGYGTVCWRVYGSLLAAPNVEAYALDVEPRSIDIHVDNLNRMVEQTNKTEIGPDLLHVGWDWDEFSTWIDAGKLTPLDECRRNHKEFAAIDKLMWTDVMRDGQTWAVPFEASIVLLYFNKAKLRKLGWSETDIIQLPQQIAQGDFGLPDLLDTTRQAIGAGIVPPGFGYWPVVKKDQAFLMHYAALGGHIYNTQAKLLQINRDILTHTYALQRQLVEEQFALEKVLWPAADDWANELVWDDTVAHGRVLFATGHNYDWGTWANEFLAGSGGEAYLADTIGYALFPSNLAGHSGHALLVDFDAYVIPSAKISGRNHQHAACALLAKISTPTIQHLHTRVSGHMRTIETVPPTTGMNLVDFSSNVDYMRHYLQRAPNQQPQYESFMTILLAFLEKSETGEVSASIAAAQAIRALQDALGDALIVE